MGMQVRGTSETNSIAGIADILLCDSRASTDHAAVNPVPLMQTPCCMGKERRSLFHTQIVRLTAGRKKCMRAFPKHGPAELCIT